MKLLINGREHFIENLRKISDLPAQLWLEPRMVLIEHNGIALHRSEWESRALAEGDRIEILQVAAGG